ncbi:MAG: acyl carrier protein [Pseudoalteromonas rhizosphaerae]|jgi:acyl carrier protein|uniref:Acyl carrier protein n=1 Tax=Pseudoalteromonas neustonica TaxID=1840331 RepID=A0ABY3FBZ3_9GAMM|nr:MULTISPECIES: acyl carrier protein [Pseudoalteromonas]MBB1309577.1 acyl carrier protein [Pseudoalteromonas sp. SR41-8]TVU82405.1 acyl carrier protein [Pseudoalteromonas neustonica]
MKNQLINFLYQFFTDRGCAVDIDNILELSFKDDIALDSFEVLTLVMQIELTFGIKIEPQELLDPKTNYVSGFVDMVMAKQ